MRQAWKRDLRPTKMTKGKQIKKIQVYGRRFPFLGVLSDLQAAEPTKRHLSLERWPRQEKQYVSGLNSRHTYAQQNWTVSSIIFLDQYNLQCRDLGIFEKEAYTSLRVFHTTPELYLLNAAKSSASVTSMVSTIVPVESNSYYWPTSKAAKLKRRLKNWTASLNFPMKTNNPTPYGFNDYTENSVTTFFRLNYPKRLLVDSWRPSGQWSKYSGKITAARRLYWS